MTTVSDGKPPGQSTKKINKNIPETGEKRKMEIEDNKFRETRHQTIGRKEQTN